jgi:hypothetical protein
MASQNCAVSYFCLGLRQQQQRDAHHGKGFHFFSAYAERVEWAAPNTITPAPENVQDLLKLLIWSTKTINFLAQPGID